MLFDVAFYDLISFLVTSARPTVSTWKSDDCSRRERQGAAMVRYQKFDRLVGTSWQVSRDT